MAKKNLGVNVYTYTLPNTKLSAQDIANFNAQYPTLTVKKTASFHDRFLIIDGKEGYHIGASLKDAGKKCFGINRIEGVEDIKDIITKAQQTGKAFVANPFQKDYEEKIYKTGDLASYNEQGELVFGGRKDFQIKHMGHRIELEEIELAINAADGVERGFCTFDEERNRIAAYYVGICDKKELRDQLKEKWLYFFSS